MVIYLQIMIVLSFIFPWFAIMYDHINNEKIKNIILSFSYIMIFNWIIILFYTLFISNEFIYL